MLRILLVEDNGADARLTGEILKETGIEHELVWFNEGDKALDHLRTDQDFGLFIIDLNLPKASGLEVVAALRRMGRFSKTPVVIMTGSLSPADRSIAGGDHLLHYIIKPMSMDEIDRTVLQIKNIIQGIK
ncbi:MAG TPA: response regulator [Methanomassiliicoccales archaeon]